MMAETTVMERPLCILIGALGGQGGGVLADWLVETARLAGYPAQATSTPGVAQRTGATTYYFELFPEHEPLAEPLFCLFPSAGDVDMVVALEPTEAGKALERGYISAQTTVISSTDRVYSTAEKSVAGEGRVTAVPILNTLSQAAQTLIPIQPNPDYPLNALVFGAIIGSGVLLLSPVEGRAAIEAKGLAVKNNLAGFSAGLMLAQQPALAWEHEVEQVYDPCPDMLVNELKKWPEELRPLLGHVLTRLIDYQDATYAQRFLERLHLVLRVDNAPYSLTTETARRLAAWMSYEDVIRVAQLKTRPGRLARIRAEVGAQPDEPVTITDFLSPSRAEMAGVLPARLNRLLPGGNGQASRGWHLAWPTSAPLGYAALKFLAGLRWLRPRTAQFAQEQLLMESWLAAVVATAPVDYDLACQVAEVAVWIRGYGVVHERGHLCLGQLLANWEDRLMGDLDIVQEEVAALLHQARHNPDIFCKK